MVEIIIALLGLVIAYFQWNGEKRAAKEEKKEEARRKEEKAIIQKLLKRVSDAEQCSRTMSQFRSDISAASRRTDNDPNQIMSLFDKTIEQYEGSFRTAVPILKDIYDELLKNEERFPMSHGYGRYIIELREILDYDAVERERRRNGYDSLRLQAHQTLTEVWNNGGAMNRETALKLGSMTEKMVQALEPYYRHAQRISAVLYELKGKYNAGQ